MDSEGKCDEKLIIINPRHIRQIWKFSSWAFPSFPYLIFPSSWMDMLFSTCSGKIFTHPSVLYSHSHWFILWSWSFTSVQIYSFILVFICLANIWRYFCGLFCVLQQSYNHFQQSPGVWCLPLSGEHNLNLIHISPVILMYISGYHVLQ